MRKMNCAKFNFDVFTKTLTISKTFERNAAIYQSTEQKMMKKYSNCIVLKGKRNNVNNYKHPQKTNFF